MYSTVGRSVVCDKNDIVYFGTNDGLYKFNGYSFKKFPSTGNGNSVCPLINIRALLYDGEHIWLGGPEGFASYDPEKEAFKTFAIAPDKEIEEKPGVRGFCQYSEDVILAASYRSYTIIHTNTSQFENIKLPDAFPVTETAFIVKMAQDSERNTWVATVDDGLYYTKDIYKTPQSAGSIFPALANFPCKKITEITPYTKDTLLVGTTTGLFAVNSKNGNWKLIELKSEADGSTKPYIKKILKLNNTGDLFIATMGNGLFHYIAHEKRFQNYTYQNDWYNTIPDNYINDIAAGRNGMYWIAMEDSWLAMVNTWLERYEYILIPKVSDVKTTITVTDMEEDNGDYLLTTSDGFMIYNRDKKFTYFGTEFGAYTGEYLQTINKLDADHFSFIIFGSGIGVFNRRNNTFGYLQPPGKNVMGSESVFDWLSYIDDDNNYYMVDFDGNYLRCNYLENTIDTLFTPAEVNLALPVVLPETEATLWIASASRLYYYDLKTKKLLKITQDKNGNKLPPVSFQEDIIVRKNGMLYIASADEGFFEYDRNKNVLTKYTTQDGLLSNVCFALFENNQHQMYILASNSVASFDETTKKIISYPCPKMEGVTQPYVDMHNILYMGVNSGILKIPLDSLAVYTGKPEVKIISIKAGGKVFSLAELDQGISIHYKDFPLVIQYELIDYFSPEKNIALYTMNGWDKTWTEDKLQTFSAYYSKITPGNYTFQLKGKNAVNPEFIKLSFPVKVIPPFWQTGGFITLLIISGLLIPYAVYRYRLNQLRNVQTMRNKIAADLHDEVGSSLSSIKMLSEIAVMQEKNKDTLKKISNNAKESVEKMQDIIWMVNPKNDNTENMLQRMEKFLYEMCSVKNISYEFINHVPSLKLDMQQRKNLLLVFKEAVNNAAKYSNAKKIVASIYQQKRSIELKVQDDGIGFDLQKIEPGNGLDSMQMRANELRGTLVIDSILNEGTTIIFTLPL